MGTVKEGILRISVSALNIFHILKWKRNDRRGGFETCPFTDTTEIGRVLDPPLRVKRIANSLFFNNLSKKGLPVALFTVPFI